MVHVRQIYMYRHLATNAEQNCQCLECPGPCLSPLSRPPYCGSCRFRHGPTYTQCSYTFKPPHPQLESTPDTTPDNTTPTADNIGTMFSELSPYSPLHRSTESFTTPTSTPTAEAIDAAITAQTNLAADFDFEGGFFLLLRQPS